MTSVQRHTPLALNKDEDHKKIIAIALVLLIIALTPLWLWWRASQTAAAFSDSEVLESNHLGAGTLDLEVGEDTATFAVENMAPGDVLSGQLELMNAGTLPLTFVVSGTSDGDELASWLRFDVWRSDAICRPDSPGVLIASDVTLTPRASILIGDVADVTSSPAARLAVDESTIVCLGAHLLLEAPNAVQGRRSEVDLVVSAVHDLEAAQ